MDDEYFSVHHLIKKTMKYSPLELTYGKKLDKQTLNDSYCLLLVMLLSTCMGILDCFVKNQNYNPFLWLLQSNFTLQKLVHDYLGISINYKLNICL